MILKLNLIDRGYCKIFTEDDLIDEIEKNDFSVTIISPPFKKGFTPFNANVPARAPIRNIFTLAEDNASAHATMNGPLISLVFHLRRGQFQLL
jgi:hypothetical protein